LRQGPTIWTKLAWNLLCSPGWPQTLDTLASITLLCNWKTQGFHGHIFWRIKRHTAHPKGPPTHCNRRGLGTSTCKIITVVHLPFGWSISCLDVRESHYPLGVLHCCFKQGEYCPAYNLQPPTCVDGPSSLAELWKQKLYATTYKIHGHISQMCPVTNVMRNAHRTVLILGKTF
jgi:hypothetical protein